MPEYYSGQGNPQWGSEEVDLLNITNAEDLENLNVYIIAQAKAEEGGLSREKVQDLLLSEKELKILYCCAPAYLHEDTELME